jgi:hypothetical protein
MAMLSACSTISLLTQGEFDASGYVQGILDASYKGEFETYIQLTEDTKENAQIAYDAVMETKAEGLANYTAVTLTDENKAKFIEYSKQIFQKAKYEVSNATKTDQGFTVDIAISPMTILQSISEEGKDYVTDFNSRNENGEFAELTDDEFATEYAKGIMQVFENSIANIQYADPVTITVSVILQDDKLYTMEAEEFTKIDSVILKQ